MLEVTKLVCQCGEPLSVTYNEIIEGKWSLGHFGAMCGPLITHEDFAEVLRMYQVMSADDFYEWNRWRPDISRMGFQEVPPEAAIATVITVVSTEETV